MQAYDQSGTFGGAMKALDGFEGLLEHGIIAADVRHRTSALLTALSLDLAKVICCPICFSSQAEC